jgi:ABC-type antimicrobial peptide transport system permease subunit
VIALLAIGQGASAAVESRFSSLGTNVIYVVPGSSQMGGVRLAAGSAPTLTYEDALAIASEESITAIGALTAERGFFGQIVYQGLNTNSRITATTPTYQEVLDFYPAKGEFFTNEHVEQRALVAVLGDTTATNLFGDSDPIDQTIRVNAGGQSVNLRVIGVMQQKGGTGFNNRDEQIIVPLSTGLSKLQSARTATGAQQISTISIKARSAKDVQLAVDQVTAFMTEHKRNPEAFQVRNVQDQIEAQKQASDTLTILLGAIAGISLVVGGIGIMNIMIVSVTERTHEIGIRKAVGATPRDILLQFLMEALVVSVLGGLLGIAAGLGTAQFVEGKALNGQEIQTVVVPASLLLAFGVSVAIGLFFGIYPASRAARLHPIEALRYE